MGVSHGELRDEIYCQLMKQLTSNPDAYVFPPFTYPINKRLTFLLIDLAGSSSDSVFRGWQLFCVILVTFPPSKNLEAYVGSFIQERITTKRDDPGRLDIMAKYCLGRLGAIAKKGPRGKPPTFAEIETASVRTITLTNASIQKWLTLTMRLVSRLSRMLLSTRRRLEHHSTLSSNCNNALTPI